MLHWRCDKKNMRWPHARLPVTSPDSSLVMWELGFSMGWISSILTMVTQQLYDSMGHLDVLSSSSENGSNNYQHSLPRPVAENRVRSLLCGTQLRVNLHLFAITELLNRLFRPFRFCIKSHCEFLSLSQRKWKMKRKYKIVQEGRCSLEKAIICKTGGPHLEAGRTDKAP